MPRGSRSKVALGASASLRAAGDAAAGVARVAQAAALSRLSETDIQKAIKEALGLFPGVKVWRNNNGVIKRGKTFVRYGLCPGSADLIGVVAPGRFFSLEVKKPGEQATELQTDWLCEIRRLGGFGCVVTSVPEAIAALKRAQQGENE
jgi:hypothetical protein